MSFKNKLTKLDLRKSFIHKDSCITVLCSIGLGTYKSCPKILKWLIFFLTVCLQFSLVVNEWMESAKDNIIWLLCRVVMLFLLAQRSKFANLDLCASKKSMTTRHNNQIILSLADSIHSLTTRENCKQTVKKKISHFNIFGQDLYVPSPIEHSTVMHESLWMKLFLKSSFVSLFLKLILLFGENGFKLPTHANWLQFPLMHESSCQSGD